MYYSCVHVCMDYVEDANLVSCHTHAHKVVSHKWIGCLEAFLTKTDFRSESLVRKMFVDSGTMLLERLFLHRRVEHLISADVQAAFLNIWKVAHELVRHESNARVLAAWIDE